MSDELNILTIEERASLTFCVEYLDLMIRNADAIEDTDFLKPYVENGRRALRKLSVEHYKWV